MLLVCPDTSENDDIYQLPICPSDGLLSEKSMIIPKISLHVESKLQLKSQHIDFAVVKHSIYVMQHSSKFKFCS